MDDFSTGDPAADAAIARLEELDERDLDDHVGVYEDIHGALAEVLDRESTESAS